MTKKLKSAWLLVTNNCNLKCKYCWRTQLYKEDIVKDMTERTAFDSMKFLEDNGEEGMAVTFFGGEPLLRFDLIKKIIQKYPTINYGLYTNSTLLSNEIIDFLYQRRDFVRIVLSIDGDQKTNIESRGASYDDKLVKKVLSNFLESSVRMTVFNPTNCYEDALRLFHLGAKIIDINVPRFMKLTPEYHEILGKEIKKIKNNKELDRVVRLTYKIKVVSCKVGEDYVAIGPEGDIYPCDIFYWRGAYKLGNIYDGIDDKAREKFFMEAIKKSPHSCCVAEELFFPEIVDYNYSISKECNDKDSCGQIHEGYPC